MYIALSYINFEVNTKEKWIKLTFCNDAAYGDSSAYQQTVVASVVVEESGDEFAGDPNSKHREG